MADLETITPHVPAAMALDRACALMRGVDAANAKSFSNVEQSMAALRALAQTAMETGQLDAEMVFGVLDLALGEMDRARFLVSENTAAAIRLLGQQPYSGAVEPVSV